MNLNTGLLLYLFEDGIPLAVYFLALFGVLLVSYLFGSINTAIVVSRLLYKEDIRTKGSGNAGMTNMHRTYGGKAALLTLLGDLSKTVVAVCLAGFIFGFGYVAAISTVGECYLAGLFAVLGHVFPVYYRFKGGKGVLVTAVMALILSPVAFAILIVLFIIIVAMSRYVSLGSVIVATLYPVLLHGYFAVAFSSAMPGLLSLSVIVLACLIVWCHRHNLKRIGERTENKLTFGKK